MARVFTAVSPCTLVTQLQLERAISVYQLFLLGAELATVSLRALARAGAIDQTAVFTAHAFTAPFVTSSSP